MLAGFALWDGLVIGGPFTGAEAAVAAGSKRETGEVFET